MNDSVPKYEDLTDYEVKIIQTFCERNEDDFRKFVEGFLFTKSGGEIKGVNAEQLSYEFCKPLIREKKIADLLDEE